MWAPHQLGCEVSVQSRACTELWCYGTVASQLEKGICNVHVMLLLMSFELMGNSIHVLSSYLTSCYHVKFMLPLVTSFSDRACLLDYAFQEGRVLCILFAYFFCKTSEAAVWPHTLWKVHLSRFLRWKWKSYFNAVMLSLSENRLNVQMTFKCQHMLLIEISFIPNIE